MPLQIIICEEETYATAELERHFSTEDNVLIRWQPDFRRFVRSVGTGEFEVGVIRLPNWTPTNFEDLGLVCNHCTILVELVSEDWPLECMLRDLGVRGVVPFDVNHQAVITSLKKLTSRWAQKQIRKSCHER